MRSGTDVRRQCPGLSRGFNLFQRVLDGAKVRTLVQVTDVFPQQTGEISPQCRVETAATKLETQ